MYHSIVSDFYITKGLLRIGFVFSRRPSKTPDPFELMILRKRETIIIIDS